MTTPSENQVTSPSGRRVRASSRPPAAPDDQSRRRPSSRRTESTGAAATRRTACYEACGLKIHYDHTTRTVTIRATLRGETAPAVEHAATIIPLNRANTDPIVEVPPPQPAPHDDVAHGLRVLPGAPH